MEKPAPAEASLGRVIVDGRRALLRSGQRGATIRAPTRVRLPVLDKTDFQEPMATDGDFRQAIRRVADQREAAEAEAGATGTS